jgi:hypothetical protein
MSVAVDKPGHDTATGEVRYLKARSAYIIGVVDDGENATRTNQQMANTAIFRGEYMHIGEQFQHDLGREKKVRIVHCGLTKADIINKDE